MFRDMHQGKKMGSGGSNKRRKLSFHNLYSPELAVHNCSH